MILDLDDPNGFAFVLFLLQIIDCSKLLDEIDNSLSSFNFLFDFSLLWFFFFRSKGLWLLEYERHKFIFLYSTRWEFYYSYVGEFSKLSLDR